MGHVIYRNTVVLGLTVGLVLFALPAIQSEASCAASHASPMTSAGAVPMSDCDCCGGASGPTSDVTMPCSACVAMAAPTSIDLPQLAAIRQGEAPTALRSLAVSIELDHPPTR